ncbi:MAG: lysophospholipase [Clostridia bacterium]|nr:lysophospholipase [Clostridia bacterium]
MEKIIFDASCGDGNKIAAFMYPAKENTEVKGTVQICHGMAEYFGRYTELVAYLNDDGWNVCAMDMMGHGATYDLNKDKGIPKGYFGDSEDSAMAILRDEMKLHKMALEYFGEGKKQILYGHSMGSFVVRNIYMTKEYTNNFDKYIFSATMGPNPAIDFGIVLSKLGILCGRKKRIGKLLNFIAFGSYNSKIKNNKTEFDWICTDEAIVKDYCDDPMAGFIFTWKGFKDLFTLVKRMQAKDAYKDASDAPCLMTFAEADPVTGYGAGAKKVYDRMVKAGKNVTCINYGPYRHEIHREPDIKNKCFKDIVDFINRI